MAYGAMAGCGGHIGGVERQTSMTARWLAQRGWHVSLVTWKEGPPGDEQIDSVRVVKTCGANEGGRALRFVHPRWTSLVAALRRADADVYYHNNAEYVTGQVAMWCRYNGRRFVYSVANDPECDPKLPTMRGVRERFLYRYGIHHADRIIVQTQRQQTRMRNGFELDSVVLPMPCIGPEDASFVPPSPPKSPRVVWAARIKWMKRLEWLLDVAERLPQIRFEIAGRPDPENDYTRALLARAARIPNVVLLGAVPRELMAEVYQGALCLCCTSVYEGFPNTFIEAWSHGVPVVSTFDPDDLIAREGAGVTAADRDEIVRGITAIRGPDRWLAASRAARACFVERHSLDKAMARFEQLFQDVLSQNEGGCAAAMRRAAAPTRTA
jgi:glycosyltransferase involved in cell wall biosynthesis